VKSKYILKKTKLPPEKILHHLLITILIHLLSGTKSKHSRELNTSTYLIYYTTNMRILKWNYYQLAILLIHLQNISKPTAATQILIMISPYKKKPKTNPLT